MSVFKQAKIVGIALIAGGIALGTVAAVAATDHKVMQKGKTFSSKKLTAAAGDSVTFVNDDSVKHNIVVKGTKLNSGVLAPGQEFKALFDKNGKFKVRCGIHPKMKLTVLVK